MRRRLLLLLLLTSLVGCAIQHAPGPYGNFVQGTAKSNDTKLVDDVVRMLLALYPPARTQFNLQQTTPDYFGIYLVESLRANGYAVSEFQPQPKALAAAASASVPNPDNPTLPSLTLSYVVDQGKSSDLYRVTLYINGQQSLGRAYQVAQDGVIYPAGYWVRKE